MVGISVLLILRTAANAPSSNPLIAPGANPVGKPRPVTNELLQALTNKHLGFTLTVEMAKALEITKIEMLTEIGANRLSHWLAKVTTRNTKAKASEKKEILFEAERNTNRERWTSFGGDPSHSDLTKPDAVVDKPKDFGDVLCIPPACKWREQQAKPLTLYRLLECVWGSDLHSSLVQCWLYVYRMLRFGRGLCRCGACTSVTTNNVDDLKLTTIQKEVADDEEHDPTVFEMGGFTYNVRVWND